jgi:hypothetical protein
MLIKEIIKIQRWQYILCSCIKRIIIVKMTILFKVICTFSTFPDFKNSMIFFTKIEKELYETTKDLEYTKQP